MAIYGSVVVHPHRRHAFKPGFHRATQVGLAALLAVLVADVDPESGDAFRVIRQRCFDGGDHIVLQLEAAVDVAVSVDWTIMALEPCAPAD